MTEALEDLAKLFKYLIFLGAVLVIGALAFFAEHPRPTGIVGGLAVEAGAWILIFGGVQGRRRCQQEMELHTARHTTGGPLNLS
ncbi:hypothetical protein Back2_27520 [Nocardioides baekrokdamisoli]|uniref:Uncharacterized protein n=1 Tax=Nocardioides baekrokdamisoli TaxID=1804624 RepID=A0A3G9IQY5_9ACTN|nr:hypothetical protein [Nocardioides baekrokdamisoli]BBH18465.1 hypothetical protein Back2_27520 [Nocardioides baekrokdamisoli]